MSENSQKEVLLCLRLKNWRAEDIVSSDWLSERWLLARQRNDLNFCHEHRQNFSPFLVFIYFRSQLIFWWKQAHCSMYWILMILLNYSIIRLNHRCIIWYWRPVLFFVSGWNLLWTFLILLIFLWNKLHISVQQVFGFLLAIQTSIRWSGLTTPCSRWNTPADSPPQIVSGWDNRKSEGKGLWDKR